MLLNTNKGIKNAFIVKGSNGENLLFTSEDAKTHITKYTHSNFILVECEDV